MTHPLHIGIDGRELVGQPTGVGRYLLGFLRVWAADPECPHHFTIFLPGTPPAGLRALLPRLRVETAPAPKAGTWWEQTELPRMANAAQLDVFYAPAYTAPLRLACPFVLVIHDVSYFAHREWFGRREGMRRRLLTRLAARRAAAVVAVSRFSADEIQKFVGIAAGRITLAPGGSPPLDELDPVPRAPIVLYTGSLLNRRRIPELMAAFALTARAVPDARLVLAGANRTHPPVDVVALSHQLGIADRVDWRAYVSDDELITLYRQARVFAFLSDYEGFGMTPFEAIAHGAPALVLDTPVSREVYGSGARLVPLDTTSIAEAMTTLLTDTAARQALLDEGRARAGLYRWDQSARITLDALEAAATR